MASVIIGATTMKQLETDIGSINLKLSHDVLDEIEKVHRQYPMPI
jgi:aryl-alcohol dehydrogenase-like predicted oxidoreductase